MSEKEGVWLVRAVSGSISRVLHGLSSSPMRAASQIDPETRSYDSFRDAAWGDAEMLEREARNIRAAVAKYHAARDGV